MNFYLGTHKPRWLEQVSYPLFVSRRTLARLMGPRQRRGLPRALGRWALDSGGFSELKLYGRWETPPRSYVAEVRRFRDEIGGLDWAAIQDWMCEPFMLNRTGLTTAEHQCRTVESYLELRDLAPEIPWTPVIQGYFIDDYMRHVALYDHHQIDLWAMPIVGLGSVCRRQATQEALGIIQELASLGLNLHGFGLKKKAFQIGAQRYLTSSDSLAWSFQARHKPPLPGCSGHKNCANCLRYADRWRTHTMEIIEHGQT